MWWAAADTWQVALDCCANESCLSWMSHVPYECVMSHMNASCHLWMSHVMYEWVTSRVTASCRIWLYCVTWNSYMNVSGAAAHSAKETYNFRLLKIAGLFCKRALWKRRYSAKETYNFHIYMNVSWATTWNLYTWICQETRLAWHIQSHMKSHVPFERVLSRIDGSCPIWM